MNTISCTIITQVLFRISQDQLFLYVCYYFLSPTVRLLPSIQGQTHDYDIGSRILPAASAGLCIPLKPVKCKKEIAKN